MHFFAFLMFFAIGIALLGMLFLLCLNIVMAFRAFKGDAVVYVDRKDSSRVQALEKELSDLRSSVERQRNDDWLRSHNKTT